MAATTSLTIAAAELSHETNTFSSVPTGMPAFERSGLRRGAAIGAALRRTETSFAGFFDGADRHGFLLVPILSVWATPSGMVDGGALTTLLDDIVTGLGSSRPDGVLLALHGAMVSDVDDDADGYILEHVRAAVGPDVPIVVTLDLHANISQRMVDAADMLIGYDTYPHVDQRQRAAEAADVLVKILRGAVTPVSSLAKPPMMPTSQNMTTDREPMHSIIALAREVESRPGVVNVTIAGGFPPADTADTGFSVLVTTDGQPELAASYAGEIGRYAWEERRSFLGGVTPWPDAAMAIRHDPAGPTVLVDIADNPWTGGPGDSVELIRFLRDNDIRGAAVAVVADPTAVRACEDAGPGSTVTLNLGGHIDQLHGEPLEVEAYVRLVSDGRFRNEGPMHAGVDVNLGPTAVVVIDGIEVLVTTHAETPIDLNVFRAHGIEPTQRNVLALKGKGHFRAAFEPIASQIILVEGPGITGSDLSRLEFRKIRRPIWPIDPDVEWG
ncbi:MAG TPA: M81 family metallopeptidase [Thermomicrobiales bacterium]|nr:M81 family metallopeptidase [Thermomicrobiales bacterium]